MEELIKQYEDYYLIKCYSNKKHCSDFNNGIIYLKQLSYFHNVENDFQQDKEGLIFHQPSNGNGSLYFIDPIQSGYVSELMKKGEMIKGIEILKTKGTQMAEIKDLSMNITGFLSCFYLIPKKYLKVSKDNIDISPLSEYNNLFYFLNNYAKEQGYTYFSIYDASKLIEKLYNIFNKQNYNVCFGCVTYEDIDEQTKIKWLSEKQIQKIVFTKPLKFKYQREFRFFVNSQYKTTDDSISIISDSLESTIISSLVHLTAEYCKKLKQR